MLPDEENELNAPTPLSAPRSCYYSYCSIRDPLPVLEQIPKSIDLRELGLITKAKDQKDCGSCWAFGVTGLLENSVLMTKMMEA